MQGHFSFRGELIFEIDLLSEDGLIITVNALLDTGFTGWIAINSQDIDDLGWIFLEQEERQTARGIASFRLYEGTVIFDGQELTIPAVVGEGISDILIGLAWLENRRLVVDKKLGLLTLSED